MSKLSLIVVAAVTLAFGLSSAAQAVPVTLSTFTFSGQCDSSVPGNCTGTGNGTLVLENYTLGAGISTSNFQSFTYQSTVYSFSFSGIGTDGQIVNGIGTGGISNIFGNLPTSPGSLPGQANVTMLITTGGTIFNSGIGFWCAGVNCNDDQGTSSVWSETPLPAALPLFATGIGGLGLLGWRRKRKAQAVD
jgi:hypothetical protein